MEEKQDLTRILAANIAARRKSAGMTQAGLAEMLGYSDKTISKWETGRGIPDTAIMNELCQVLGISINELLSGEKLSVDNYNGKAEENMVNLLKDTEQQKEKQKWSVVNIVLNLLWVLLLIFMIFILGMGQPKIYWFIDTPSLILNLGFLILGLGISGQMKYFWKGVKAAYSKSTLNIEQKAELEKAEYALGFGIKFGLMIGILNALISFVTIMAKLNDPVALGPNLAVMTLTVLYGIAFSMVLMVMKARVHNRMEA